jgi:hypothetical protein
MSRASATRSVNTPCMDRLPQQNSRAPQAPLGARAAGQVSSPACVLTGQSFFAGHPHMQTRVLIAALIAGALMVALTWFVQGCPETMRVGSMLVGGC